MEFEYVKHYYRNFSIIYTYTGGTKAVNVTQKTTNVRDYERNVHCIFLILKLLQMTFFNALYIAGANEK
jgi:hypothetical protein